MKRKNGVVLYVNNKEVFAIKIKEIKDKVFWRIILKLKIKKIFKIATNVKNKLNHLL